MVSAVTNRSKISNLLRFFLVAVLATSITTVANAANTAAPMVGPDVAAYQRAVGKAIEYFGQAQSDDGSFSKQAGCGVTALVATGLMRHGRTPNDPVVAKA